ncbi:F-box domain-containing protein [Favolaschia claudopus]|uniref:F-box domain-containing protein n=1 Tax=Favolaschia claudopus TaxID=2862362 RepID=A0AAW0DJA7_9AGAR
MLQYMAEDRTLLAEIKEKILPLEQKLRELRIAQDAVQRRLRCYKYPVLSLPTEIIAEVFRQLLPSYPSPAASRGTLSPTNLTHVCRKWREIALGIPSLWRAVKLIPQPNLKGRESRDCVAALWAKSSGSYPLSIDADIQYLAAFLPHRTRWEHLSIRLDLFRIFEGGSLPSLKSLRLSADHYGCPAKIDDAPLLRRVFIRGFDPQNVALPWEHLTILSVTLSPSTWLPVLQHVSQLVHCVLQLSYDGPVTVPSEIPLLRLETLEFECRDKRLREFLRRLVVPSLRCFKVNADIFGSGKPFPALRSLLSKWNCTLEDLRINNSSFSEAAYRTEFPSIKHIVRGDLPLHAFTQYNPFDSE